MKFRLSLDTAAFSVLAILTALFGLTVFLGAQAGTRVTATLPQNSLIGPFQVIKLTFSEPVDPDLTEALFSIQPALDGQLKWLDPRTLQFVPTRPFELDAIYKLTLSPGDLTSTGLVLKNDQSWEFQVRDPLVAYLLADDKQSSIWAMDLNNNPARQITPETIKVISFDTSFNGEFIIFASANEQGGIDLWRVSRAGNDASVLLDCGRDRCTTPIISPDGTRIAYSREAAGPGPDLPFGSPRIWLLDLKSEQNSPVYEDQQILGYGPSWSPDSTKLASFDGLADQIRLLDLKNNQQYIFPSNTDGPLTWSPDSTKLLFTDMEQKEDGLRTHVRIADLSLNDSSTLIGAKDERDYSYHSLAWSPVEDSIVLGFRDGDDDPAQIFWLFDPGLLDGIIIANQPDYTYNSPRWNPWGTALIFQQFKLRGAFKPEIGLWKPGLRDPLILTEGLMPHWLP
ncbi:MAG: PD40 domain-containing protein [Chloroflexi bacterium]|nr:PD40 domain-containing protein [Chloroflexota bacterium]